MKLTHATLAGIFLSSALSGCGLSGLELNHSADSSGSRACGSLDDLNATMKKQYAEEPAMIAQMGPSSAFVMFATPPGAKLKNGADSDTWTLIAVPDIRKNKACTFAAGEKFRMVTNPKPRRMPGSRDAVYIPSASEGNEPIAPCVSHVQVIDLFERKAGMVRLAYGQIRDKVLEIYGVPVGTKDVIGKPVPSKFSIIETDIDGRSCLMAKGMSISMNAEMLAKYSKDPKPGF